MIISQKSKEELKTEFKEFYKQEIVPILKQYEHGRGMDVSTLKTFFLPFGLIFFFIFLATISIASQNFLLAFFAFISVFGSFVYMFVSLSKNENPNVKKQQTSSSVSYSFSVDLDYEKPLKKKLAQGFVNIFGCKFLWTKGLEKQEDTLTYENKLKSLNIFPKVGTIRFDDVITGLYNNVYLQIAEFATGMSKFNICFILIYLFIGIKIFSLLFNRVSMIGNNEFYIPIIILLILFITSLIFILRSVKMSLFDSLIKGLIVSFKFPKKFKGHTFIIENALSSAKLHLKDIKNYQPVTLESTEFNSKFKVYTNDQIEARYLLTTAFMERFENIRMAFDAEYIRAEFKDGELVLLMGVDKDLFKMGSLFEESSYQTFLQVFEEIYSVLYLTTYFKMDESTGL